MTGGVALVALTFGRADKLRPDMGSEFRERDETVVEQTEPTVPALVPSDNSFESVATDQENDASETSQPGIVRNSPQFDPFAYLDERRDEPWASQKEQRLYDAISRIPGGVNSANVDCRTTFCRVEVVTKHTCAILESRDRDVALTEEEERQVNEHAMTESIIWRGAGHDGSISQCNQGPGIYLTLHFDRMSTTPDDSTENR